MSDNRGCSTPFGSIGNGETVCIDTLRVLDACRDRDCHEDVRVFLSDFGQEIIEHTTSVRASRAKILWTYVGVDPIRFNQGFYQVTVRFYIKVEMEACMGIGRNQEFCGIAVAEKRVVLYGSVGNVSIYRSDPRIGPCDIGNTDNYSTNLPTAVVEVVDPVLLSARVAEPGCHCCTACCCNEIPAGVASAIPGALNDDTNTNMLLVTLGIFSVIRIERPAQYLINATDYCVPDKECTVNEEGDPCSLFRQMAFPVSEFCPPSLADLGGDGAQTNGNGNGCGCGCGRR